MGEIAEDTTLTDSISYDILFSQQVLKVNLQMSHG